MNSTHRIELTEEEKRQADHLSKALDVFRCCAMENGTEYFQGRFRGFGFIKRGDGWQQLKPDDKRAPQILIAIPLNSARRRAARK